MYLRVKAMRGRLPLPRAAVACAHAGDLADIRLRKRCAPRGPVRRGMKKPSPTLRNEPTYYQVGALIVLSSVLNNEGYL